MALNDHELPPKSLKSINLLDNGLSFTRGETRSVVEIQALNKVLCSLLDGDIVSYDLRASNNDKVASGRARINRLARAEHEKDNSELILVYAFELEPI